MNGREFFEWHMDFVARNDMQAMVGETFSEDAIFCHNFPFFEGKPPYYACGHKEIVNHLEVIFSPSNQGEIQAGEPFNFVATDDFIGFQIFVESPNTGMALVTDTWVLKDNRIKIYYAMAYFLGGKRRRKPEEGG